MSMGLLSIGIRGALVSSGTTTTRLAPVSILASSNLSGGVTDIDEDVDSDDRNWMQAQTSAQDTSVRVEMENPPGTLSGTQEVRARLRRTSTTSTTADIELWENGSFVATLASGVTPSSASEGSIHSGTFEPGDISGDGSDVEIRVEGQGTSGGPVNPSAEVEMGAIEWNAVTQ